MRKNYMLSLDEEKAEELKGWLEPKGLTFSGYINSLVCEQLATIREFKIPADTSEMKLADYARLFQKMAVSLSREVKKKK